MSRILAGRHAVSEALRARASSLSVIYVDDLESSWARDLAKEAKMRGVPLEERTREELDALAKPDLKHPDLRHQGAIAIGGEYGYASFEPLLTTRYGTPFLIALDEITDPHNFGAIVRSAVALGATGIIILKHRAAPVTPVVVRASAGATEHARIARVSNLTRALEEAHEAGIETVGLDAEGSVSIDELGDAPQGRLLVVGSEGRGLRRLVRENCNVLARITLSGPIASLNASVAAGIALHAAQRRVSSP